MIYYRSGCAMSSHRSLFLRESRRLYLLYVSSGIAAIPAGLIYALFVVSGHDDWWVAVSCILLGFWMARRTWAYLASRLEERVAESPACANSIVPVSQEAINAGGSGFGVRLASAAAVASAFVMPVAPAHARTYTVQISQTVAIEQAHPTTARDSKALVHF